MLTFNEFWASWGPQTLQKLTQEKNPTISGEAWLHLSQIGEQGQKYTLSQWVQILTQTVANIKAEEKRESDRRRYKEQSLFFRQEGGRIEEHPAVAAKADEAAPELAADAPLSVQVAEVAHAVHAFLNSITHENVRTALLLVLHEQLSSIVQVDMDTASRLEIEIDRTTNPLHKRSLSAEANELRVRAIMLHTSLAAAHDHASQAGLYQENPSVQQIGRRFGVSLPQLNKYMAQFRAITQKPQSLKR